MTLEYEAKPKKKPLPIADDIAYVLPMAVFLLFTWLGGSYPKLYPASYIAKTLIVPVILYLLWNYYTKIRWTHITLGVIVGVLGIIQWVGMEKLLLHFWPNYWRPGVEVYDPRLAIPSAALRWPFIILRWAGAVLVVPVMEELFWRDFLWRQLLAPNDFKLAEVGEWDWKPFAIVSIAFASVHVQWITAIVWGLMIATLLVKTRSLGACIVAHAVTNLLLGVYVLITNDWYFW